MRWCSTATGTFGTIQVNSDGSYVYTLTKPFDTPGRQQRRQHESGGELHLLGDGRQRQHRDGTITVNIVDDVADGACRHRQRDEGALLTATC